MCSASLIVVLEDHSVRIPVFNMSLAATIDNNFTTESAQYKWDVTLGKFHSRKVGGVI